MPARMRLIAVLCAWMSGLAAAGAASGQTVPSTDAAFHQMGAWAVRLDEVEYGYGLTVNDALVLRQVKLSATLRNTSSRPQYFAPTVLDANLSDGARVFTDEDGPASHRRRSDGTFYSGTGPDFVQTVAPNEERRIYFNFTVGNQADQLGLREWTLIERDPFALPHQRERGRATLSLPKPAQPGSAGSVREYRPRLDHIWVPSVEQVNYSAPAAGRTDVAVRIRLTNVNGRTESLSKDAVRAVITRRNGDRVDPFEVMLTSEASPQSGPAASAGNGGSVFIEYHFQVGDEAAQRDVRSITLIHRRHQGVRGWTDMPDAVELPLPPLAATAPAPAPPPAPAPAARPAARLQALAGRYATSRDTTLNLLVEGDALVGQAVSNGRPAPREALRLQLMADGTLRGSMSEERNRGSLTWFDVILRFSPDASAFAGEARFTHAPDNPVESYTGRRIGGAAPTAGAKPPAESSATAAGFTSTDYLDLRADGVSRRDGQVEVYLTVRNASGERRSLQQDPHRYVLVGSDGREFRNDGNWYSRSGADHLQHTVWMTRDEQASSTHVFPGVPGSVAPARLLIRDGDREVASFSLAGLPEARAASAGAGGADGPAAGEPVRLQDLEVTIERIELNPDRDWDTIVAIRNASETARPLLATDLTVSLYGADGETRHANGDFYDPARAERTTMSSGMILQPGSTVRVRLWHPQSRSMTPVRYGMREGAGATTAGAISGAFIGRQ